MLRKPSYITLAVVVVLGTILLNLPAPWTDRLKLALNAVFLPLVGLSGSVQRVGDEAGDFVLPRGELVDRMQELRETNQKLRLRLLHAKPLAEENARLRQALEWKAQAPWNLKLGRVIGRDPENWWRTIHIDLGSHHQVRTNFPVLTAEGLVGRISRVNQLTSEVVLVGDPNCQVAALVEETRETGIITPTSSALDPTLVQLSHLSRGNRLDPLQTIVTSGLGSIFPKDIPIGFIVDSRSVGYGLYAEARVKLHVNLNRLEEVWVLFP